MPKLLSCLAAAPLAITIALGSTIALNAAPLFVPKVDQTRSDVEQVKKKDKWYKKKQAQRAERERKEYSRRDRDDEDEYYYARRYDRRYERDDYDGRPRDREGSFNLYLQF